MLVQDDKGILTDDSQDRDQEVAPFSQEHDYPVMIVFDNHPDSRPYFTGIKEAEVVYEFLAEGGATRFAAVFSGAPRAEKIGPVRSARPYVVETASGWSAFFLHAGGSPEALDLIKSGKTDVIDLNEISGLGPVYFWRDAAIERPHNLFTSGERIADGLKNFGLNKLPSEKLTWKWGGREEDGKGANSIYVDFSEGLEFDSSYEYDFDSGLYKRFLGGVEHKDRITGEQFSAANIIVQFVPKEGYYPSGEARISLDMIGEGDIMLFQNGRMIEGTWKKVRAKAQTEWFDSGSLPIVLMLGQTWVEIVPGSRVVSFE